MSQSDELQPSGTSILPYDSTNRLIHSSDSDTSEVKIAAISNSNDNSLSDYNTVFITEQENISPVDISKSLLNKKRVKFPDDGNVIMGFMEPPCHWSEVTSCTTEELIDAYRASCFKHRVNPFPQVLEQLKGFNPSLCNERYEMLSLKGQKFSMRDMETIEQILRRVQFQTLDFESTNLDDEMAISLFDMIEYYESCAKLNISGNPRIGPRGYQSCSRMLKRTPCLEVLLLRNTLFLDASLPILARSIRMGCNLRQLYLDHCNICGRNLLILVSAMKMNETIKELHLIGNNLMPTDGIQLGALLKFNRHLRVLDVRNNCLGDVGTSHLCDGLFEQTAKPPNGQQSSKDNGDAAFTLMGPSIMQHFSSSSDGGLETLILWNNGITHLAMIAMAQALRRCAFLLALNLGCNPLGSEGAHALREGLLYNRSLTRLWVPACKITCEGAVALAEVIADTKNLQRIDLRENDIRTGGLMALAHALRLNDSVTRIDLDSGAKKEPNMRDYQQTQRACLDRIVECLKANQEKADRLAEEQARLSELAQVPDEEMDGDLSGSDGAFTVVALPPTTLRQSELEDKPPNEELKEESLEKDNRLLLKAHSPTDDLLADDLELLFQAASELEQQTMASLQDDSFAVSADNMDPNGEALLPPSRQMKQLVPELNYQPVFNSSSGDPAPDEDAFIPKDSHCEALNMYNAVVLPEDSQS